MSRRKKEETINEELQNKSEYPLYCELQKCPHLDCLLHYKNSPFNVIIRVRKFKPDKDWNCNDMVKE